MQTAIWINVKDQSYKPDIEGISESIYRKNKTSYVQNIKYEDKCLGILSTQTKI